MNECKMKMLVSALREYSQDLIAYKLGCAFADAWDCVAVEPIASFKTPPLSLADAVKACNRRNDNGC